MIRLINGYLMINLNLFADALEAYQSAILAGAILFLGRVLLFRNKK